MKHFCSALALALSMLMLLSAAWAENTDRAAAYEAAMALYKAKEYEQAIPAFEALGTYKDSQKMLANSKWYWKEQRYDNAVDLYKAGSYEEAKALFTELGSFEESKKYVQKCDNAIKAGLYEQAKALMDACRLTEARDIYMSLGSYQSSEKRIAEIDDLLAAQKQAALELEYYDKAVSLRAEGKLAEARDLFVLSGNTQDSTDQIYEILEILSRDLVYDRAVQDMSYGLYADAQVRFEVLGETEKAAEAQEALLSQRYDQAEAAAEKDASMAFILYLALGDYKDSAARAEALKPETGILALYDASEALRKAGRAAEAAVGYAQCEGYKDSTQQEKQMRKDAESSIQFERAHILTDLWQLEEANAIYKSLGDYSYASRMGIERISAAQLRDDATSPMSETFIAPDGSAHRYRIFKGVPRWVEAEAFCRALCGHMSTMTTEEENDFVYTFMCDSGFTTAYFGLVDEERDHVWEWVTGEPVEYCPWDSGEPSYSPRERYGMYFYKHKGTWNDAHFYEDDKWGDPGCSFICEWDM